MDKLKESYNREETKSCIEANVYIAENGDTPKAIRQIMAHIDTLIESKLKEQRKEMVEDLGDDLGLILGEVRQCTCGCDFNDACLCKERRDMIDALKDQVSLLICKYQESK